MRASSRPLPLIIAAAAFLVLPTGLSTVAQASTPRTSPQGSTVGPIADFNGDGYGDLAVGVPDESLGSIYEAGGVNVIYGSGSGLTASQNRFWSRASAGVLGSPVALAAFGVAVATGDFNHDGYSDLAVSAPNDPVGSVASAGSVTVLYGSSTGLGATGNQLWSRDSGGVTGTAADGDLFGQVLAARDFNSDGYTDLAIGIPGAQASGGDAGAVTILYGSSSGLTAKGNQLVNGDQNEHFGSALAAGNFDGSGGNDLAVGAPFASVNGIQSSGATYWLAGSSSGLGSPQLVPDSAVAASNLCGEVLAAYNRDNDAQGYADLAVGCPSANVGSLTFAGAVDIHLGSGAGLGDTVRRMFGPNPQDRSSFGDSLAAADFGRDDTGFADDLVVGQADRTVNGQPDAGRVVVFYQTPGGTFYQVERQGLNGTKGVPEQNDSFGNAVTTGDFNGDGWADVAVGVPGESLGSAKSAGGVNVLYGSPTGITTAGNQFWSQNSQGIAGTAEGHDQFGLSLAGRTE